MLFFKNDFVSLFLSALGLYWCSSFFLVVASGSHSLVAVCGLLTALASLVVKPVGCRALRL